MRRLALLFVLLLLLLGRQTSTAFAAEEHAAPAHGAEAAAEEHAAPAHATTTEAAEASHASEGHGEAASEGPPIELPDITEYLKHFFGGPDERAGNWSDYLFSWRGPFFAIILLLLVSTLLLRGAARREMIPGPFQNAIEYVVEAFYNFVRGILGHNAREFAPFLGTLFLYIWFMNLSGLLPLFKAPTSLFETTLSLALVVFIYVQITGFRKLGVGGYFYHLVGSPTDVMGWSLVPLMLPLHIIGELAKPVSLSLRLFGNIMGEDVLIAVFTGLGVLTLSFIKSPIGLPLEFPFIFLGLLLSTIQALVFTLLSTIYISQMLPHEEEHAH
jgi:F-type H+-transporting ATPase subunit a